MFFFAVWAGACFTFCCLGGDAGPAQTRKKKKHAPAQTQKKKKNNNTPPPLLSVFFLLFGRVGVFMSFLLFGRGSCFFAVWPGGVFLFCCLGGGVFMFLLFGRAACLFLAVWAGDRSSLTYRSAWLVFKRSNNKKRPNSKKKHGFRVSKSIGAVRPVGLEIVALMPGTLEALRLNPKPDRTCR